MNEEGVLALLVAILYPDEITPEEAFRKLYPKPKTEDLKQMRETGMTYSQIADIYGVSRYAIYVRLKRLQQSGIIPEEVK